MSLGVNMHKVYDIICEYIIMKPIILHSNFKMNESPAKQKYKIETIIIYKHIFK